MGKFIDLVGKKFGKLTVIKYAGKDKFGTSLWLCKCECGNKKIIRSSDFKNGKTKSCGCIHNKKLVQYNKENKRKYNTLPYDKVQKKLDTVWRNIKRRCGDKNNKDYGGRGITICKEWKEFENFYNWAINNGYKENLTIDRINVNGNYEPDNCRWVTQYFQNRNQRSNRIITYNGKTLCLTDWSKLLNIPYTTLIYRLNKNWDVKKLLNL